MNEKFVNKIFLRAASNIDATDTTSEDSEDYEESMAKISVVFPNS